MSERLTWNDLYSVHVQRLDGQHKRLFEVLNELEVAINTRSPRVVSSLVEELLDSVRAHFAAEEEVLRQTAYPGLERHRAEHQRFTTDLLDSKRKVDGGLLVVSSELITYLQTWLRHHILSVDKGYCPYLPEKG
jgi:hemerythrin